MSKETKKYPWLNTKPNSAKTAIAKAEANVPLFKEHMQKFNEQVVLKSYVASTIIPRQIRTIS